MTDLLKNLMVDANTPAVPQQQPQPVQQPLPLPTQPPVLGALDEVNKHLLTLDEVAIIENQTMPAEFNNPEQPTKVEDHTAAFQQAITFMHRALQQGFDTDTCNKSIAQVNTMLKQNPALEEILLPEDVGCMVKLLERNYGTLVFQKSEEKKQGRRGTSTPRRQTRKAKASEAMKSELAGLSAALNKNA